MEDGGDTASGRVVLDLEVYKLRGFVRASIPLDVVQNGDLYPWSQYFRANQNAERLHGTVPSGIRTDVQSPLVSGLPH